VLVALAFYAWAGAVALARPISEFYAAGHAVAAAYNGMAIAACFVAALAYPALAGAAGPGWRGPLLVLTGGAGGLLVIAFLIAPYLSKFGGYTLPDFLGDRFGSVSVRPLAVVAVFLSSFPALAIVLLCLAAIVNLIFAFDLPTGVGAAAATLLLCTFLGGLRSASRAGVVQYAVLLVASLAALAILLWQRGAFLTGDDASALFDAIAALKLKMFAAPDRVNRFALLFCLIAGTATLPHLVMRSFAAPTPGQARTAFLYTVPFLLVLVLAAPASTPLLSGAPIAAADTPSAAMLGLIATASIAALVALGSGLLIAMANAVSYDLYYKSFDLAAPADRRLLVARGAILAVAGVAAVAALYVPQRMMLMFAGASFSLAASAFLPVLLLGLWWKRATGQGALAGMIAGLVICLYYMIVPRYFPYAFYETSRLFSSASEQQASAYDTLQQLYYLSDSQTRPAIAMLWELNVRAIANWWGVKPIFAAMFAVPVGFIAAIAVSLFTPAPSEDVQNFVADLRKPQPA
jgi:cation/acetate symporter